MKRILIFLLSSMMFLCACGRSASADESSVEPPTLQVLFIHAGKADAILLCAGDRSYLVDTGEKTSVPAILGALELMNVETLDGVFLTHTHDDHTGGLKLLAENVPISVLYHGYYTELTNKGVNRFEKYSEDLQIPHIALYAGQTLELAEGVSAEVLGPLEPNGEDDNDQSLVLRIVTGDRSVLLTGDMQFAEESSLIDAGTNLRADVLKVGNHGNPDATSDAFARAVSPSVAVITTDTQIDTDSANPRVVRALTGTDIYITEEYPLGVLVTITESGELLVSEPSAAASASLRLSEIDRTTQTAVMKNDGGETDISGYMIFSVKGGELFRFPEGTLLPAGGSIAVCCEGGDGDLLWPGETEVWNEKKDDTGILYDRFGRELDRLEVK